MENDTGGSEEDTTQEMPIDPAVKRVLTAISAIAVAGALLRAFGVGNWDWQTLLYLVAAGLIIMLPWIRKLKVGKDGVEAEWPDTMRTLGVGGKKISDEKSLDVPGAGSTASRIRMVEPMSPAPVSMGEGASAEEAAGPIDLDDPQKGRWGGLEVCNGRRLSAVVRPMRKNPEWFNVRLMVSSTDVAQPLTGNVRFHLHPTFKKSSADVDVQDGKAVLELVAWGAFTVGAECDGGKTRLELDLATLPDAPRLFLTQ